MNNSKNYPEGFAANRRGPSNRASAILIGAAAVLMAAFMAMHPQPHTHELSGFIADIVQGAPFNRAVHGTLIALLWAIFLGFVGFTQAIGPGLLPRAGLTAFAAATICLTIAATINGLIVPSLAEQYKDVTGPALDTFRPIAVLCHEANAAFDQLGIFAASAAVLCWSLALLPRPGAGRAIGIFGVLVSILPPIALLAGKLPMSVHGFGAFVLVQVLWYIGAAALLFRLPPAQTHAQ